MYAYSTIFRSLFWTVMGILFALIFAGANLWAQDFGLQMNWWKWSLAALWYCLLSLSVAAAFTLIGEKERRAGLRMLCASFIVMIVLGATLWLLL